MKINQLTPSQQVTGSQRERAERPADPAPGAARPRAEIESSGVREALAASSDVDMKKVAALRAAIGQGQLSLDPEALAAAVLAMHKQ